MCGIAGYISEHCSVAALRQMGDAISHRGPDESGYYHGYQAGFVSKRLSIVDITDGKQPAFNEDRSVVIVFNGEIFNYQQLRKDLEEKGHVLANRSDTAVLPHMYEQYGTGMFDKLSGQFAIAIYDTSARKLILARDRLGILPLFYYHHDGEFLFGSEIKALLATGRVGRSLSYESIFDIFTFWSPQQDRTVFKDIFSVLPGEYLEFQKNMVAVNVYYKLKYKKINQETELHKTLEETEALLVKAVETRLTGDVKISTYLSGGLDSSLITAILASRFNSSAEAFSLGFDDTRFDESKYQQMVCRHLGIKHHALFFKNSELPELIRKIIWHTEAPLLRAGPVPLFKLSELVNQNNVKVVLSGEGADELFGGYDIFREVKIRKYLRKYPDSTIRQILYRSVNQFSDSRLQGAPAGSLNYFYTRSSNNGNLESHCSRWGQFNFFQRFFSDDLKLSVQELAYPNYARSLRLENVQELESWTDLQKSQYLEIETFLSSYLLSSQGDRIAMANSVEVRYPFLDDALIDYTLSIKDNYKIKALNEKYLLKKIAERYLPAELLNRKKFPYRSPLDVREIMSDSYMRYILSKESLQKAGLFNADKITGFFDSVLTRDVLTERETMLLMGVMTTQIFCDIFNVRS
jgi:asparagine synthase (glutamine-hydrolysing)